MKPHKKKFIPSICNKHLLSIYCGAKFCHTPWGYDSERDWKGPCPLGTYISDFLASLNFYQVYHTHLQFWITTIICFLVFVLEIQGLTVRNHVLSASKVCVNFGCVLTVAQWCFSSSYMCWVIPGCHVSQQTPHLCPSNDLHSLQSFNCLSPQTLGKQWPGLTRRNLKWGAWTR